MRLQLGRIFDGIRRRHLEAFSFFSPEEMKLLEHHKQSLINKVHDLCMKLQTDCPQLFKECAYEDINELQRYYRAQHHAMDWMARRWSDWEDLHALINDVSKMTEAGLIN